MSERRTVGAIAAIGLLLPWWGIASAAIDLRNATVERLEKVCATRAWDKPQYHQRAAVT